MHAFINKAYMEKIQTTHQKVKFTLLRQIHDGCKEISTNGE
jgi:hypothetical protein